MKPRTLTVMGVVGVVASSALGAAEGVEIFVNDFEGWSAATGDYLSIDFGGLFVD